MRYDIVNKYMSLPCSYMVLKILGFDRINRRNSKNLFKTEFFKLSDYSNLF